MLRATKDGVTLSVRAQPGAKKTSIAGVYGEGDTAQLKIQVHAPPIDGRANAALLEFVAETFGLTNSAVELVSGLTSRNKLILLRGISFERVEAQLGKLIGA
jgi:hypothetical protein